MSSEKNLQDFIVAALKEVLRSMNQVTMSNKAELIARIYEKDFEGMRVDGLSERLAN